MSQIEEVINEVQALGYSEKEARDMINTFQQQGGLSCYQRWPREFSFFSNGKNVLDILLEKRMV